jgi:sugar phosphate isomerase/epimerase
MNFKERYPFRLGCTSYVLPDHILPNVQHMAGVVDDIELVLFESENESNMPDKRVISSMQRISDKQDITFSVHFPIDRKAGASDQLEQEQFLQTVNNIIDLTSVLPISGYLLHFEGLVDENDPVEVLRWKKAVISFSDRLSSDVTVDPSLICVENIGYPPDLHRDIVNEYGFSHCIDLGHLWLQTLNWREYIEQVIDTTKIIHLHGVDGGKDHQSLKKHSQRMQLQELKQIFSNFAGSITLEVFGEEDTWSSLSFFGELWQ